MTDRPLIQASLTSRFVVLLHSSQIACRKKGLFTSLNRKNTSSESINLELYGFKERRFVIVRPWEGINRSSFSSPCLCHFRCLQFVVEGCGQGFNRHVDQDLLDLIFSTLKHTNRFVRETGFQVCGAIVGCAADDGECL